MKTKIRKKLVLIPLLFSAAAGIAQHDPTPEFKGKIGKTVPESTPYKAEPVVKVPAGAPNVVWILLDDVGFGSISSFGGLVNTPVIDSLAFNGLRYTNFHTTAICSPTRASLLTGRNQHSAHMGLFPETAINFPGYDARIPFEKATIAEVLKENGYNTFATGKWHITPVNEVTQAGPFNRWPTGRGFEHYFGFMYGETDQFHPQLWENNSKVEPDTKGKHFTTLITDKAISYISDQKSAAPDKPFFLYYAPGAAHAPHQVEKQWIEKYKGKFDKGWDKYREEVLARQKKLGIVPQTAQIPPRNPGIKEWETLSADEKKVFARFMEAYAGILEHTDYEIGRVVNHIRKLGELNNTLIVLVIGDNGASKEGSLTGSLNGIGEVFDGSNTPEKYNERIQTYVKNIDKIGTEYSSPNYPLGWAMAANTPFKYLKQDAFSEGGTRNPLILFYPEKIKDKGGIRTQYSHVNSIWPTTVELIGAKVPEEINGYKQEPAEGVSLAYSVENPQAEDRHHIQYYEISGTRAIYKDGWKAGALHKTGDPFENDKWELYNVKEDFNERVDLAAKHPDKLKELQALFDAEAVKYNIFPLKDGLLSGFGKGKSIFAGRSEVTLYPGISQLFGPAAPSFSETAYSLNADVELKDASAEGVLVANGGRFHGFSFFISEGKLQVAHNSSGNLVNLVADRSIVPGKHKLRYDFNYLAPQKPTDGLGTEALYIDDIKVAEQPIVKSSAFLFTYDEGFDVGQDLQTEVSSKYQVPFKFTGLLNKITISYDKNNSGNPKIIQTKY